MRRFFQLSLIALLAVQLHAAELANLRNGFSLRHERHEVIGDMTRLYMGADPAGGYVDVPTADIESFETAPPDPQQAHTATAKTSDLKAIVAAASSQNRIDADFIASVIHAESANNPQAVSPKGAQGLMQLMPGTASKLGVKDSFDPSANVDGGVRYLRELLLEYHGDMAKALAAYNAGPQRVQQYQGVPPYRETHAYVARVINDFNRKKLAERKQQAVQNHSNARLVDAAYHPPQKAETNKEIPATPQANSGNRGAGSASTAEPRPTDSATVRSHIEQALGKEPSLNDSHIGVSVTDSAIELSGTVASAKDKQTADRIAQSFDGNRRFSDKLMVTGQGSAANATRNDAGKSAVPKTH